MIMTIKHYQEACYSAETDDDDFEEETKECLKNLMILITMVGIDEDGGKAIMHHQETNLIPG